jgi:hypothetical protein
MLLIVIAALCVALVVQERRAARREAELQARLKFPPQIVIMDRKNPEYQDAYFINGEIIKVGPQAVGTPKPKEGDEE